MRNQFQPPAGRFFSSVRSFFGFLITVFGAALTLLLVFVGWLIGCVIAFLPVVIIVTILFFIWKVIFGV